ncbi:hypothetical protein [Streptomyces sp. AC555_RSS877]|uniref:hypothetical protein n=1 Tax=Streptomyces sp. AC555_RSS877 TaxID=2823688 RepID=UPI001C25E5FC|nr:hypothetical protein [Streptomyces sp. AC555_RSS877]
MNALDIAIGLIVLAALVGAGWTARGLYRTLRQPDYRTRNDQVAARRITRLEPRPEPAAPGQDQQLLNRCNAILAATNTRKENRP